MAEYPFLKGHGTENDFVLLPDHDGSIHGDAEPRAGARSVRPPGRDRRRRRAPGHPHGGEGAEGADQAVEWFMDYRNADGWPSEMCGNGIRVFLRYLVEERLVDPSGPIDIATRDGIKTLLFEATWSPSTSVHLASSGRPRCRSGAMTWPATHVDMGNPHAVAFVDDEETLAGLDLARPPEHDDAVYPDGVNVELVVRRGERQVGMRVHERGSGETRSCGTGAGAVLVARGDGRGAAPAGDVPRRRAGRHPHPHLDR